MSGFVQLSEDEFAGVRNWLYQAAGIHLGESKKALVAARLNKRLGELQCGVAGYLSRLRHDHHEAQCAIDLLTTNETHFFREPAHLQWLEQWLKQTSRPAALRIWSAACSSGEEPYSIAMVLADGLGDGPWSVVASDLSQRVLQRAMAGQYATERARSIPPTYRQRYCLRGVGAATGRVQIDPALRQRVQFRTINLLNQPADLGMFDLIFLRNVMIYFDLPTKRKVVEQILTHLRPGGCLLVGHAETLNGVVGHPLRMMAPAIYRWEGV